MRIEGVLPPITTPFDAEGGVDAGALTRNVRRWMSTDLAGIVVLGSNGEAPFLDEDESERVIRAAREEVPRGRLFLAGTGRESTRATIRSTKRAAEAGADAVLVRTPSFFKSRMTDEAFVAHYRAVADASPVPVVLYNFTAVTGVTLSPDAVAKLAEHPNVVGVKESGSDMAHLAAYRDRTPPDFAVLCGSATSLYAALSLGASGGILALACVLPEACVRLFRLVGEGRHAEARELQKRIAPLARLVTSVHGVPGLKAALDLAGYEGGPPRGPLLPASTSALEEIRLELAASVEELAPRR